MQGLCFAGVLTQVPELQERFGFEGQYFSMPTRAVLPKPYQKPHPPIWVPGSGSVKSVGSK